MLLEFEKKVADFIKANELFSSGGKVLLAVSGGADSTALLSAMQAMKAENVLNNELFCAHINHQLRGSEGDSDEEFVIARAAGLKLAVTSKRVDVREFSRSNKLSIETAARQLRIEALIDIAKAGDCNQIATAHQKNDNAETILQRLIRGTGFRGLGGIWPAQVFAGEIKFVRPLLCVGRDEIVEYLKERNLQWRQDLTNYDCTYRRNYIRRRLLPALQRNCSDSVVERLSELALSARRFYGLVNTRTDEIWSNVADCADENIALDLKIFSTQPQPIRVELLRRSLKAIGSGERNLTQRHFERILKLAGRNVTGGKIELPGRFMVWREYGKLIFAQPDEKNLLKKRIGESVRLEVPGRTSFGRYFIEAKIFEAENAGFEEFKAGKTDSVEWFDLEKLKLPLAVRYRQTGDRFVPLGLAGEKRLGKFLTAQRVPQRIRREVLVITDIGNIIWVWPIRISEQTRITGETRQILQLEIIDSNNK